MLSPKNRRFLENCLKYAILDLWERTQECFRSPDRPSGHSFDYPGMLPVPGPGLRARFWECVLVIFALGSRCGKYGPKPVPEGRSYSMLPAVNRPSGQDFGRTATGKPPKSDLRPAFGRPEGGFRCFPSSSPAKIRPGRLIPGPEAPLRNIE